MQCFFSLFDKDNPLSMGAFDFIRIDRCNYRVLQIKKPQTVDHTESPLYIQLGKYSQARRPTERSKMVEANRLHKLHLTDS